jgi:hypothetical protein
MAKPWGLYLDRQRRSEAKLRFHTSQPPWCLLLVVPSMAVRASVRYILNNVALNVTPSSYLRISAQASLKPNQFTT